MDASRFIYFRLWGGFAIFVIRKSCKYNHKSSLSVYLAKKIFTVCVFAALCMQLPTAAQRHRSGTYMFRAAERAADSTELAGHVNYLSSCLCEGRGSTQRGAVEAAWWLTRRFSQYGLVPFGSSFIQTFRTGGNVCHNVVGMIPCAMAGSNSRYIVIGAHYDGIGMLEGKTYPGADSNASGVAAMLGVADMLREAGCMGGDLKANIIFVAFDAKQLSMAGSEDFWKRVSTGRLKDPYTGRTISPKDISMMVNLDILGGCASPIHAGRDAYLLMLGCREDDKVLLHKCNRDGDFSLDLTFDYYGSKGFTDMFLGRVSDQKVFLEHGIYSVMFTSGISMDTNRLTDTPDKISPTILEQRTRLIYRWIWNKLQQN